MSQYKRVYENEIKKTETENNNVKMPNSKVVRDTAKKQNSNNQRNIDNLTVANEIMMKMQQHLVTNDM